MERLNVNMLTQRFSGPRFGDPGQYMGEIGLLRLHVSLPARL